MSLIEQICADFLIQKVLAVGPMEKLTAQTKICIFQQDVTVPTR